MKLLRSKIDFEISEKGISIIENVAIGGIHQYLLIQSENINNPVLLILHGGPGLPIPGTSSRSRDYVIATNTKELVKHYTVVFWDQRGSGKTFNKQEIRDSLNIDQFVSDANEVVQFLKIKFNKQKIYVAGYSWGTIIGLRLVDENPSDYYAYIGISQIINWVQNDVLCLEWTLDKAKKHGNNKAIKELQQCGNPPYIKSVKQWSTLRKWMGRYNSMVYSYQDVKHPGMKMAMSIILRSPDYSIIDIFNTIRGFQRSYTQTLIEDFAKIDYKGTIRRLEIPVFFIHGKKDVHIFGDLVEDYFNELEAPAGKQIFWLDKSSHMFHPEDAKEIEHILISIASQNHIS